MKSARLLLKSDIFYRIKHTTFVIISSHCKNNLQLQCILLAVPESAPRRAAQRLPLPFLGVLRPRGSRRVLGHNNNDKKLKFVLLLRVYLMLFSPRRLRRQGYHINLKNVTMLLHQVFYLFIQNEYYFSKKIAKILREIQFRSIFTDKKI